MANCAEISLPIGAENLFSYAIPQHLKSRIKPGMRVRVPLGGRKIIGYVLTLRKANQQEKLKDILALIDEGPVINAEELRLSKWMSSYYLCSLGKALQTVVPFFPSSFRHSPPAAPPLFPARPSILNKPISFPPASESLSEEQREIRDIIKNNIEEKHFRVLLLQGYEEKAKFPLYVEAISYVLQMKRQAIILLPEISQITKVKESLNACFPDEIISIFHSELKRRQHYQEWESVKKGEKKIVIGTRSAVFSPLPDPGIIIIMEEDNANYKEQKEPRYHAREVALKRANLHKALVILDSFSPSLQSYYQAQKGKYTFFCKKQAFNIEIVDRCQAGRFSGQVPAFSPFLERAIREALERKEKSILFLNRRGFARFLLCLGCGGSFACPHCHLPLIYHKRTSRLRCHYCRYEEKIPTCCPQCQSKNLHYFGMGTEQLAEEAKKIFPQAKIGRLDQDIVKEKKAGEILREFQEGKIDILVGTQLIFSAPLTDLPSSTIDASLIGIISGDTFLNLPDFHSAERTFQMLMKIINAAGKTAQIIIQTHNPHHYVFSSIKNGDEGQFYRQEIKIRRLLNYSPFACLANLQVSAKKKAKSEEIAMRLEGIFQEEKNKIFSGRKTPCLLEMLGPAPSFRPRHKDKHCYQIILKAKRKRHLDQVIAAMRKKAKITLDIDPLSLL